MQTITELETPIKWYYELYPEEEEMSEAYQHRSLSHYLYQLLTWYYRAENHLILANLVVYRNRKQMTSPDVAVVKDVNLDEEALRKLAGWKVNPPIQPAPTVVFEISSEGNWDKDITLDKLPDRYAKLGVQEYFAFDPLGVWGEAVTLKGWRNQNGQPTSISLENGRMWSSELNCWLVPDNEFLWLDDINGNRLLTESQAEAIARDLEHQRAEKFAAKLRELGIDPDKL